jgi:hypothetical protein
MNVYILNGAAGGDDFRKLFCIKKNSKSKAHFGSSMLRIHLVDKSIIIIFTQMLFLLGILKGELEQK